METWLLPSQNMHSEDTTDVKKSANSSLTAFLWINPKWDFTPSKLLINLAWAIIFGRKGRSGVYRAPTQSLGDSHNSLCSPLQSYSLDLHFSVEELPPSVWPMVMSARCFLHYSPTVEGTVGNAIPRQVGLGCLRIGNKLVSSVLFWFCLKLLPQHLLMMDFDL